MAKKAIETFDNGYGVLIEQNRRTLGNQSKLWQVTLIDAEWEEIVENSKISKDGVCPIFVSRTIVPQSLTLLVAKRPIGEIMYESANTPR